MLIAENVGNEGGACLRVLHVANKKRNAYNGLVREKGAFERT